MGRNRSSGLRNRVGIWHIDKQVLGHRIHESTGTSELNAAELMLARRIEQIRQACHWKPGKYYWAIRTVTSPRITPRQSWRRSLRRQIGCVQESPAKLRHWWYCGTEPRAAVPGRQLILKGKMVGRAGFEPATNWLKANCSTN